VVVTADRFIANQKDGTILAHQNVVAHQGIVMAVKSDEAKFERAEKIIHFWGDHHVYVHWQDAKGISDFESDKGWVTLDPKHARLIDHVKGHIIPL
jgi:uncharacterized protein YecA (UPF0149 family)